MANTSVAHQRANSFASNASDVNELSDLSGPDFELEEGRSTDGHTRRRLGTEDTPVSDGNWQLRHKIRAAVALILWYTFSILLSVYNKNMFSQTGMDFRFPIITTSLHQLAQILLSLVAIYALRLPPSNMSKGGRFNIIPASLASAGDIGLGNCSLLIVTLSFYTMLKSSALGFVLLFSVLFGLEAPSLKLVLILIVMTLGVFLMAAGEANFSFLGFFLVLGASCSSGLRWALVKLLLNGGEANNATKENCHTDSADSGENTTPPHTQTWKKVHPVQTIMMLSPGMFISLFIIGCAVEGPRRFFTAPLWSDWSIIHAICGLLFPGVLAFCMTWAEFDLLNTTSPLTLAIGGICKEVATILVSVMVFHDRLTIINSIGLVVTIISIGLYHYHRSY